jgi:murein DD-endopeptidase MepM/ murein hydrolase activator NlpD
LLAAVALVAYLIQPGDTLSGIAASHGVSLASVEASNTKLSDPNLIYTGQTVEIPSGSSASQGSSSTQSTAATDSGTQSTSSAQSSDSTSSTTESSSSGSSSSSSALSDIPGVPSSFAACVAYRESTDLENPAADGNAYGIIPASGYNVYGTSLANQKQVFGELYAQYGTSPWVSDGCAG